MLKLNVDFFSSGKVTGWTNLLHYSGNRLFITDNLGKREDITRQVDIIRADVNSTLDLPQNIKTGFSLNLFDIFNTRVTDFSFYVNDYEIWSSKGELRRLELEKQILQKRFFEIGTRRIIVIYNDGSWLSDVSGVLNYWNINQFNKALNNGIAISFMSTSQLNNSKSSHKFLKSYNIFLIEREAVSQAIVSNSEITKSPILILEENLDLELDFNGILSSVCKMNGFEQRERLTAVNLRTVIETLTTYAELFFERNVGSMLYVCGYVSNNSRALIRKLNKVGNEDFQCVVLGENKISKLSDYSQDKFAIFLRSDLLKNSYDLMKMEPKELLTSLLKRGIKVESLAVGI